MIGDFEVGKELGGRNVCGSEQKMGRRNSGVTKASKGGNRKRSRLEGMVENSRKKNTGKKSLRTTMGEAVKAR